MEMWGNEKRRVRNGGRSIDREGVEWDSVERRVCKGREGSIGVG